MSEHTGGTVTYHRAKYDASLSDAPWEVWFAEDMMPVRFSAEQGEAMGLTPPEPAPLVVTCGAHSIELSDEEARYFAGYYPSNMPGQESDRVSAAVKLAGLLRDARQDPQPASGEPGTTDDDDHYEAWKADMAKWKADRDERDSWKETARQYAENADYWRDRLNDHKESLAIQAFTAPDEDEAVMMESLVARIADLQAKVDSLTAHQPAPLSPGECLRGLLSGRDDADELIEYAAEAYTPAQLAGPGRKLLLAVGDAARGGA